MTTLVSRWRFQMSQLKAWPESCSWFMSSQMQKVAGGGLRSLLHIMQRSLRCMRLILLRQRREEHRTYAQMLLSAGVHYPTHVLFDLFVVP